MRTIQEALKTATDQLLSASPSAWLDAEVLLAHVLGKERSHLRAWPEKALPLPQRAAFQRLIQKRRSGMPVAYITGKREFWSREFTVTPAVLIPRPETECLIEKALEIIDSEAIATLADIGTGSGAIAITLAAECPRIQVIAADISESALAIARHNAARFNIQNIQFYQSDWLKDLPAVAFDMIISNPPYVAENDPHLTGDEIRFEPALALKAGPKGLDACRQIAEQARRKLAPGGYLVLEHGFNQAEEVQAFLKGLGFSRLASHTDLQGHPRVTAARWQRNRKA